MSREIKRNRTAGAWFVSGMLSLVCIPALAESPVSLEARAFRVQAYENFRSDRTR